VTSTLQTFYFITVKLAKILL